MTFHSAEPRPLEPQELASYGAARARDIAFDAFQVLWRRRRAEGMTQAQLAEAIGADEGWLSKTLRGPGNWTLKTLGALVVGAKGELEITVHPAESAPSKRQNWSAYDEADSIDHHNQPRGPHPAQFLGGAPQAQGAPQGQHAH